MSDTFRLVTLEDSGRLRLGIDMNDSDSIYRERGTFRIAPGARRDRAIVSDTRYDGETVVRSLRGNATATVTLVVKDATDPEIAIERAEEFLAWGNRMAASGDLLIECKPDSLTEPALLRVQGPATLTPVYDPTVFAGANVMRVEVSWPIAPLAEGQPMDLEETWKPPADKAHGVINELSNPSFEKAFLPWTISNASSGVIVNSTNARYGVNVGALTISNSSGNITSESMPCAPGEVKTASFDLHTTLTPRSARVDILWDKADASTVVVSSALQPLGNNVWTRVSLTATAPVGGSPVIAYRVRLYPYLTGGVAGDIGFFDAAMACSGTSSTYIDGDQPFGRWEGEPHASRSIELAESKLAEYYFPAGNLAAPAAVDAEGLHTVGWTSSTPQQMIHTGRGYRWDNGEVVVTGRLDVAGTSNEYLLSPGLKWSEDGRFFWATIAGSQMNIYYSSAGGNTALASVTDAAVIPAVFVIGREYSLVFRVEGDLLEAEFWAGRPFRAGTPLKALAFKLTESTTPKASDMGIGRKGFPLVRSWGAVDTVHRGTITRFRALPYSRSASRSPATINLLDVPGTAPARADVEVSGGTNLSAFGVIGWRKKLVHNQAWNGNVETDLDGWGSGGLANTQTGAVLARVATGGPKDSPYLTVTAPAVATPNTAGYFQSWERVRSGQRYTVEYWANEISGVWDAFVVGDNVTVESSVVPVVTAGGTWTKNTFTFTMLMEHERIDIIFRQTAAVASSVLRLAGLRFWEGDAKDAPPSSEQINGKGARPPFGLLHAEGDDVSSRLLFAGAVQAGALTGRRMAVDSATAVSTPARVEYLIDPALTAPQDAGGSLDVDFEVYAVFTLPSTAISPKLTASLASLDVSGTRQYTRENGSAGKRLVIPSAGTVRRASRIGTLTMDGRSQGRQKLRVDAQFGIGSTGTFSLEYFALVPLEGRAASPSGLVFDTTYPVFLPASLLSAGLPLTYKRFRSDLSAQVTNGAVSSRDSGISGEPIELDPGDSEMFVLAHEGTVADDPTVNALAAVDAPSIGIHVAVTPRYYLFRPA